MKCIEPTILWIFLCGLIQNTAYAMIAPFLPLKLVELKITPLSQGIIFAIYAVAVIGFSPVVGKLLKKFTGKTLIWTGMFLMGLCFALFAVLGADLITSPALITTFCIVLRIIQGIASATMQTSCYAIGASDYPD